MLDPVKAKGAPLEAVASPQSPNKNNTRRRRGRGGNSNSNSASFELKPMLGAGAVAGCTECRWHICRPDDTPTTIAAHVNTTTTSAQSQRTLSPLPLCFVFVLFFFLSFLFNTQRLTFCPNNIFVIIIIIIIIIKL
jgi:hypothetical protein